MSGKLSKLFDEGKYDQLLKHVDNQLITNNRSYKNQYLELFYKNRALERLSRYQEAYEVAQILTKKAFLDNQLGYKLLGIGTQIINLWRLGEKQKIDSFISQGELLSKKLLNSKNRINQLGLALYHHVIGYFNITQDFTKAIFHLEKSLNYYVSLDIKSEISFVLNHIGLIHYFKGNFESTLDKYNESIKYTKLVGNKLIEAIILGNIGKIHSIKGDLEKSLTFLHRSLEIGKILKINERISTAQANIGWVCYQSGKIEQAIKYLKKA